MEKPKSSNKTEADTETFSTFEDTGSNDEGEIVNDSNDMSYIESKNKLLKADVSKEISEISETSEFKSNEFLPVIKNDKDTTGTTISSNIAYETDNAYDTIPDTKNTMNEEKSSLIMPLDLFSRVFHTTSTSKMRTNLYAPCGLWDFAGQKEFYATHQAFLTSTAIYLVVADIADDISKQGVKQYFADFQDIGGKQI